MTTSVHKELKIREREILESYLDLLCVIVIIFEKLPPLEGGELKIYCLHESWNSILEILDRAGVRVGTRDFNGMLQGLIELNKIGRSKPIGRGKIYLVMTPDQVREELKTRPVWPKIERFSKEISHIYNQTDK